MCQSGKWKVANCAKIVPERNFCWSDDNCVLVTEGGTCICESSPLLHLMLRGLCANSAIDKYYQPMNNFSNFDELRLVGIHQSWIEYDETSKVWNLSVAGSNVRGISRAAKPTFVLGKHKWTFIGDSGCSTEAGVPRTLRGGHSRRVLGRHERRSSRQQQRR